MIEDMTDTSPETPTVIQTISLKILDRDLVVREPSGLQVTLMRRDIQRGQRVLEKVPNDADMTDSQVNTVFNAMISLLDTIAGLCEDDEDGEWLEDMVRAGKIRNFTDLTPMLEAFKLVTPAQAPNRAARRKR